MHVILVGFQSQERDAMALTALRDEPLGLSLDLAGQDTPAILRNPHEWARANGISYKTAWLWWKQGRLPVPARQLPSGTILVDVPQREETGTVLYARVSSADRKADLDRQVAHLAAFAAEKGIRVAKVVAEVGSGLNGHRKGLMFVLRSPEYGAILVEHRDRLARFGSEYIEAALAASGRRLIVVEPDEVKDDLVQDMIDVLTSFCARLHGRRSARRRAEKAIEAASEP